MACQNHHASAKSVPRVETLEWHQDCLVISVLLALAFGPKAMRRLLARAGYAEAAREEQGEALLAALHGACHQDQDLRSAVAKDLNARCRATVGKVKGLSSEEILAQARHKPWPLPLLWACFQHPQAEVRGAGRQLAHLALLKSLKEAAAPAPSGQERQQVAALAQRNQELSSRLAEIKQERAVLQGQLGVMQAQARRPAPVVGFPPEAALKKEVVELRRRLAEAQKARLELGEELAAWRSLALGGRDCHQRRERPRPAPSSSQPLPACPGAGPGPEGPALLSCPLAGRRVAVVGGLKRLEKSYCQVVARLGGECFCHTGEMQAGAARLRQLVAKSDMVVCIASLTSHGAMNVVKKQCKRCRKPFCPLDGAGAGALHNLLRQACGAFGEAVASEGATALLPPADTPWPMNRG